MRDAAFLSGALMALAAGTGALGEGVVLTQPLQTSTSNAPPAPNRAARTRTPGLIGPTDASAVAILPASYRRQHAPRTGMRCSHLAPKSHDGSIVHAPHQRAAGRVDIEPAGAANGGNDTAPVELVTKT